MPRIDPLQLLKCLSVLLSPEGGILSRDEVPRLVNLMTKFSKKLVSKCVYVLILKNTETNLVDMFMAEGGWSLIQTWLQDAAQSGNWDLVREILELLLITPVDVERLKTNCLPKLIKNLSRREDLQGVAQLSDKIVQNWLVIVKGNSQASSTADIQTVQQSEKIEIVHEQAIPVSMVTETVSNTPDIDHVDGQTTVEVNNDVSDEVADNSGSISTGMFYKASVNDGKQVTKKMPSSEGASNKECSATPSEKSDEEKDSKQDAAKDPKKSKSSSSSSSRSKHNSKDKDKDRKKSSSSSSSSKSKSSSRDKDRKDKDKRRSSDSKSSSHSSRSSSSSSKDMKEKSKEKQAEKDKDTLAKIKPQTIDKLGRIPKKNSNTVDEKPQNDKDDKLNDNKESRKKPSFSILDKKATGEERAKTVKIFNSKLRSTGLEEEVKPPPPRSGKKPAPSVQLPTIPQKRPSPPKEFPSATPPEKKIKIDKIDVPERPGAIKLIPPKPKPPVLQESDLFMDALTASATTKKEPKKRKRRTSVSKDTPPSPTSSPVSENKSVSSPPHTNSTSPIGLKNIAPINFYQDTLAGETENSENQDKESQEKTEPNVEQPPEENSGETPASPIASTDNNEGVESNPSKVPKLTESGLKGVLVYTKKKGPKRSIQWKSEEDLVEIRYFELDETERVNVTKTFNDMAKMELCGERKAIEMSRKLPNEDVMEPQTKWRMLYMCDQPDSLVVPGSKSSEKEIQFAREKSVLQALYFDKRRIPDSPEEPVPENHQMSDPIMIPLEDPESQEIDLRNTPWPDPKGSPPHVEQPQIPPMFQNMPPFNPNFNNLNTLNMPPPQFTGMPPRFVGPGPSAPGFGPPNMMPNGTMMVPPNMMGPPQDMMNQVPMNPNMFGPVSGPDSFMGPVSDGPNFPIPPFNGPGPNMNMFPPNNFPPRGGRGGYHRRGGNSNSGGWVRLNPNNNSGNWKRGGNRGGRFCKHIQNHGYCRNRDNCPFVHPT